MLKLCPVSFYAYISCQPFAGNWLISSVQVWSPNDDSCCSDFECSVGPNEQSSFIFLFRIKPTGNNCVYWMSAAFDITSDRIWLCEVQLEYCGKHCWMDGLLDWVYSTNLLMIYWFLLWNMQASSSHKIESFTTFHLMIIPYLLLLVTSTSVLSIRTMENFSNIIGVIGLLILLSLVYWMFCFLSDEVAKWTEEGLPTSKSFLSVKKGEEWSKIAYQSSKLMKMWSKYEELNFYWNPSCSIYPTSSQVLRYLLIYYDPVILLLLTLTNAFLWSLNNQKKLL